MEWDDLRTFLAIAKHGNLSAAARALGVAQPTMGRRLEALHLRAGARLLERTPTGYVLTAAGERVLGNVERMEAEALAVERAVSGRDVRLEGTVRITAVETFAARVLVPLLAEFRVRHPGIATEIDTSTRAISLSRREADVAVRLAKFEQHEVVVRRVGVMKFGLYASSEFLDRHGAPDFAAGAGGYPIIALQSDLATLPEAKWLAQIAPAADVALRSNSRDVQLRAAIAGIGLACLPRYLGDASDDLVRVEAPAAEPVREIWLGVHRDLRNTPRVRAVLDQLTEGLRRLAPQLSPEHVNDNA